jgi:hypothetical protein
LKRFGAKRHRFQATTISREATERRNDEPQGSIVQAKNKLLKRFGAKRHKFQATTISREATERRNGEQQGSRLTAKTEM